MPVRTRLATAASLVAVGLLVAACGPQDSSAGERIGGGAADVAAQGYVSGDGTTTIVAEADRQPAPALSGTTLDGQHFDLADHLGEVVVLNVWASWCAPCRAEADDLAAVSAELADRGVVFVGIDTKDSDAAAQAFVERFGIDYPSVVDTDGSKQLLFRDNLPPSAIPSTLVIDRQGRVAARAIGEVDRSRLLGLIEPVLAESGAEAASAAPSAAPSAAQSGGAGDAGDAAGAAGGTGDDSGES